MALSVTNSKAGRSACGLGNPNAHRQTASIHSAYRTVICGGTALVSAEPELLAVQIVKVRRVIETGYADAAYRGV